MKYLVLIILLIFSCTPSHKAEKQKLKNAIILFSEGDWKTNFKNMVFSKILYKMYGKEFYTCCLSKDASETANFDWLNYDTSFANKASSLSDSFAKRFLSGRSDIEGIPVIMNFALEYRLSHELDSITGVYYLQFKKDSIQKARISN